MKLHHWFPLILLGIGLWILSATMPTQRAKPSGQAATSTAPKSCLAVLESTFIPSSRSIEGEALNGCGSVIKNAFLEFNIFDSDGAQIGSTIATTSNLDPDTKWRFSASITTPKGRAASWKLARVSAY